MPRYENLHPPKHFSIKKVAFPTASDNFLCFAGTQGWEFSLLESGINQVWGRIAQPWRVINQPWRGINHIRREINQLCPRINQTPPWRGF
ncbi:hypothetical protein [Bacillus massilinigeriensis]|uniref:hypothetical protein n=1 Tax=Bacillus mediterraneensis TaxID=1805474 RepID=UPI00114D4730|nr:hypothetical protein [Bacillus mediterraneensis]